MYQLTRFALILCFITVLSACQATHVLVAKRNLDVQTLMSNTIFLDPVTEDKRTIVVQIRNTSDKQSFEVEALIAEKLRSKGYAVVEDPANAHFMIQANILQVGKADPTAAEAALHAGFGAGVIIGGAIGRNVTGRHTSSARDTGAAVGSVIGGMFETVGNALVKDVTYTTLVDLQLSERGTANTRGEQRLRQGSAGYLYSTYAEQSDWRRYQTRVLSIANRANLNFATAEAELEAGLSQSIAGLF